jgi:hypothetical protein
MGVARVCGSIRREMGGIVSCYLGKVWLLDTYYLGSERCIMVFTTQYTSFASILRHRLPCCEKHSTSVRDRLPLHNNTDGSRFVMSRCCERSILPRPDASFFHHVSNTDTKTQ